MFDVVVGVGVVVVVVAVVVVAAVVGRVWPAIPGGLGPINNRRPMRVTTTLNGSGAPGSAQCEDAMSFHACVMTS